jgi:hypothetical protein
MMCSCKVFASQLSILTPFCAGLRSPSVCVCNQKYLLRAATTQDCRVSNSYCSEPPPLVWAFLPLRGAQLCIEEPKNSAQPWLPVRITLSSSMPAQSESLGWDGSQEVVKLQVILSCSQEEPLTQDHVLFYPIICVLCFIFLGGVFNLSATMEIRPHHVVRKTSLKCGQEAANLCYIPIVCTALCWGLLYLFSHLILKPSC